MLARVREEVGVTRSAGRLDLGGQFFEGRDALLRYRALFGMHQRHVQEPTFDGSECAVLSRCDRALANRCSGSVAGEGLRGAASDGSGELVEKDHQGERAARRLDPVVELSAPGAGDETAEAL